MLHTISQTEFIKNLKARKLEDYPVIEKIEKILFDHRGYVFKKPKKGDSVILLLSGGLDSVTSWGILMEDLGLHVYPLSFDRGEKRAPKEAASIKFFSKIYKQRYPHLYHEPIRLSFNTGPINVQIESSMQQLHPDIILKDFDGSDRLMGINISFGSFLLLPIYAKLYADFLYHTQNLKVRTIYSSVTLGDGQLVPHQTFTALRTIMLHLCAATRDYSWQFASVGFEKEYGLYNDKCDLVTWAHKHKIPLEHSWSCYHSTKYQCGGSDCQTCIARRDAFVQAKIKDKTNYAPVAMQTPIWEFKQFVKQVLKSLSIKYV